MYFQADMFGQDPRKKQIKDQDEVKIRSDKDPWSQQTET
jgi:hypothetical protein